MPATLDRLWDNLDATLTNYNPADVSDLIEVHDGEIRPEPVYYADKHIATIVSMKTTGPFYPFSFSKAKICAAGPRILGIPAESITCEYDEDNGVIIRANDKDKKTYVLHVKQSHCG